MFNPSVVKRSLTTLTGQGIAYSDRAHKNHIGSLQRHFPTFGFTPRAKQPLRHHFSTNRVLQEEQQNAAVNSEHKLRKAASKRATNNSLRKVAVAAQSQRNGLIRGSGKTRHVDPEADTKEVTAYCAAEKYNLSRARWELDREGYTADPFGTNLFPQVLHFQTQPEATGEDVSQVPGDGDIFIFPSGCVVAWNVPDKLARNIIERFLPPAAGKHFAHPLFLQVTATSTSLASPS